LNFDQLTHSEQELWNKFEKSDFYNFLTGEKDTVPEFCHNWVAFSAKLTMTMTLIQLQLNLFQFHKTNYSEVSQEHIQLLLQHHHPDHFTKEKLKLTTKLSTLDKLSRRAFNTQHRASKKNAHY
jgi:hypothetical protein